RDACRRDIIAVVARLTRSDVEIWGDLPGPIPGTPRAFGWAEDVIARFGEDLGGGLVRLPSKSGLKERLGWPANDARVTVYLRDLGPAVVSIDVSIVIDRRRLEEPLPVTERRWPAGSGPEPWTRSHLLRLAADEGPVDETRLRELIGWTPRRDRIAHEINAELYPTVRDLIPFYVLLSLGTGLEPEVVKELQFDCTANRSGGRVDIRFAKRRRRWQEQGAIRVADHGLFSPGSLVGLVVAITARTRRHFSSDRLWVHYQMGRFHETPFIRRASPEACPFQLWVRQHGLIGDDGKPFVLWPARLRKTHMAGRYRVTAGQLDQFSLNNSRDVAANHYAKIPALEETHETTIAAGLADALAAATGSPKVLSDDGGRTPPTGLDASTTTRIRSGELDVWVSACTGFFSSPHGQEGAPCPTPVWGCLSCENAVFTTARLPSLIRLVDHMENQRASLDDATWQAVFGAAHSRILDEVLTAFPAAVVATARATVTAGDGAIPAALLGTSS
ncbi:MAG: hypothetical protein ACRD1K_05115, partial [Acidimicrobiales bacterium]